MGSVVKYNPQHLVVYGAWLKNKDVTAAEARALCLKECPEEDPGVKNVEGWLVRFADPKDPWVPPGGHLLAQLDEVAVAKRLFEHVAEVASENKILKYQTLAFEQELTENKRQLAEKVQLLEQAEAKIEELLSKATEKPDLGIRQLLDLAQPQVPRAIDPDQF
ncbi:MAG: hypothetical protein PHE59_04920 [Patescibacteria group bacterium]|nr:hypothetical protein [Patescibacteria group bacterium]